MSNLTDRERAMLEANARLIGAASELLAELIRVEQTASALGLKSMAESARAAIALATGDKP